MASFYKKRCRESFGYDEDEVPDGKGNIIEGRVLGAEKIHNEDWHHKRGYILEEVCEVVLRREANSLSSELPIDLGDYSDIVADYH